MTEALLSLSIFAVPVLAGAVMEQLKLEKQRKEREAKLFKEQLTALACERAVEAERLAWKNRVKQSLANWEPIEWTDVRKPRRWGRHAN